MNAKVHTEDTLGTTAPHLRMGAMLVNSGYLEESQVPMVLMCAERTGTRFGESAVYLGLVEQDVIEDTLIQQAGSTLVSRRLPEQELSDELVTLAPAMSRTKSGFKALTARLLLAGSTRAIAVVSPGSGEGRSFVAANLAMSFAQTGRQTLLIDAHLEDPRQQEIFGLQHEAGLSEVLSGHLSQHGHIFNLGAQKSLSVIPAGHAAGDYQNAGDDLLTRKHTRRTLQAICKRHEVIIFDTPPAAESAMPDWIAHLCGNALMVADAKKTRIHAAKQLEERLSKHCRIAGVVLNQKR